MPDSSAFSIPTSPVAALGTIALLAAFVVAAYAAAAGVIGNAQRRRRLVTSSVYSLYGFFALMMMASALLIYAFVTHDYTIKYVQHYSDTSMPLAYKITAYWGGLDGSLMFWVSVLAAFSAVAIKANAERHRDMIGYVVAVIMAVQLFFLFVLIFNKNPFATWLTTPPTDGKGLNPLLQNYWMVIHPPSLYIGYVAATIPFAFGIGALASGRLDDQWLSSVRTWTFVCWFFLSFGLILGGRWAYEELGWGGYWAWDPVENAGLLPWFTMTAFLHSVIIQEQRGMMKVWNLVLVIISFVLTIVGTGLTRTGAVQSVHAFGEDNALALLFVLFICIILVGSIGLLLVRLPRLRSAASFESFMSREFAFLLNNWILLACALFVFFATMWPTLSQAFTGDRITLGPPFFNKWMIPLGLTLLFLAGAAPLLAYRRTTRDRMIGQFAFPVGAMVLTVIGAATLMPRTLTLTSVFHDSLLLPISLVNFGLIAFTVASVTQEYWRGMRVRARQTGGARVTSLIGLIFSKKRKYGGYIIHVSVAVMFFGFAGKAYEGMQDFTVRKPGDTFSYRGYTFRLNRMDAPSPKSDDNREIAEAAVSLFEGTDKLPRMKQSKNPADVWLVDEDRELAVMGPAKFRYAKEPDQPTTEVSIESFMEVDVYLVLTGFTQNDDKSLKEANFRIYINPLINWVWLGFALLTLGTTICLIPQRWVDRVSPPRKTRIGHLGEAALILLVAGGIIMGLSRFALAQGPPPGAEHEDTQFQGGPSHNAAGAHLSREDDPKFMAPFRAKAEELVARESPELKRSDPEFRRRVEARVAPIVSTVRQTMAKMVCMCGCTRETLHDCKCAVAAVEREKVLKMMAPFDLMSEKGRLDAMETVLAAYQERFQGQHALIVPKDEGAGRLAWLVPYALVAGGLGLLYAAGRRWVKRGRTDMAAEGARASSAEAPENEGYAELLDDELRDTD
ncbi:MAG TPA: cytochrome c-type biogenesis CcmF C-terminal domain-containing protein [Kofleriaceae bacterium]|nr:cytochrome c-type biogenesis CcmF C-terminal domain-containing protein [Kofleriaceae bacterium]